MRRLLGCALLAVVGCDDSPAASKAGGEHTVATRSPKAHPDTAPDPGPTPAATSSAPRPGGAETPATALEAVPAIPPPPPSASPAGDGAASTGGDADPPPEPAARVTDDGDEPEEPAEPRVVVKKDGPLDEDCEFAFAIEGLPVIRDDGKQLAYTTTDVSDASDHPPRFVVFAALGGSAPYQSFGFTWSHGDGCKKNFAGYRKAAKQANAHFKAHKWRSMRGITTWSYGQTASEQLDVPVADRVVEVYHHNGELVFKVPGVKVLLKEKTDWTHPPSESCEANPTIMEASYDPAAAIAWLELSYNFGDLCDEGPRTEIIELPPELLTMLAKRG
ncbi:MAG: hypothetical protein AAF721_03060 [Myxococcota bacterium]